MQGPGLKKKIVFKQEWEIVSVQGLKSLQKTLPVHAPLLPTAEL